MPVDDVRRVRERLGREVGGDIPKLIEQPNRVAEQYRDQLALEAISPPRDQGGRTGAEG